MTGPPTGVKNVEWSFDSTFIATKVESMPNAVWIWDITNLQLSTVLIQLNPI